MRAYILAALDWTERKLEKVRDVSCKCFFGRYERNFLGRLWVVVFGAAVDIWYGLRYLFKLEN